MRQKITYPCPVCAYPLEHPPADFNICPSCGVEFGYSDAGRTYEELRGEWLKFGAQWSSTTELPPRGWNPYIQILPLYPLALSGNHEMNSAFVPTHAALVAVPGSVLILGNYLQAGAIRDLPVLRTTGPNPDIKTINSGSRRSPYALEAAGA